MSSERFYNETTDVIALMTDRGFPRMKDFTTHLFEVNAENENKKLDEWYSQFLNTFNR